MVLTPASEAAARLFSSTCVLCRLACDDPEAAGAALEQADKVSRLLMSTVLRSRQLTLWSHVHFVKAEHAKRSGQPSAGHIVRCLVASERARALDPSDWRQVRFLASHEWLTLTYSGQPDLQNAALCHTKTLVSSEHARTLDSVDWHQVRFLTDGHWLQCVCKTAVLYAAYILLVCSDFHEFA